MNYFCCRNITVHDDRHSQKYWLFLCVESSFHFKSCLEIRFSSVVLRIQFAGFRYTEYWMNFIGHSEIAIFLFAQHGALTWGFYSHQNFSDNGPYINLRKRSREVLTLQSISFFTQNFKTITFIVVVTSISQLYERLFLMAWTMVFYLLTYCHFCYMEVSIFFLLECFW